MGRGNYIGLEAEFGLRAKKLLMGVVAAASDNGDPPPLLQAVWRCRNWGIPPPDDYITLHQMEQVSMAYDAVSAWYKPGNKGLTKHQTSVINWLLKVEAM